MKKIFKNPILILAVGVFVIGASSIGATRAAIVTQSEIDRVNFTTATFEIGLTGDVDGDLIYFPNLPEEGPVQIGKCYKSTVNVANISDEATGYKEYVRVIVRKSWTNADGIKDQNLDPDLIELSIADGWVRYEDDTLSKECEIYYLKDAVECGEVKEFLTGITINDTVATKVVQEGSETEIINKYVYDGQKVSISIQADAVQTHHAEDAIHGAWGVEATATAESDGSITLK
ncbi:hypothetical protein SAMN02910298_01692 [Pseudobutyrivibrio sp. YE44]|uniref:hypothetical protein n=1 Tax=Pseudobutyrivibrio sp. YE44 TaxID=1520802 RepID=UPI000884124A|nr:hypothetical protein [Pseudobutyrivibrio sp. YE44]SDB34688.1 hypothetical protein SAMN02910298_01692 [Pseudobutyrivibrio sp. YE44]